jgi:hypothetical protein
VRTSSSIEGWFGWYASAPNVSAGTRSTTQERATKVADVSPRSISPDRPGERSSGDADQLFGAASALKQAIDELAQELVDGSAIPRAGARDRFEIALTEFAALIDRTAE